MSMTRRDLLAGAAAAGVLAAGSPKQAEAAGNAGIPALPRPPREAVLRISAQEGVVPGKSLAEKLDRMEAWGIEGLEVGGRGLPGRVDELKKALQGRKVRISAICAGFEGWIIASDPQVREKAFNSMKEILTAAGALGSTGLIIVPAFNGQESLPHREARVLLTGFQRADKPRPETPPLLAQLGDHAAACGTRILLEPLNREECYFLRTVADGASMCRDLSNQGIAVMGDFWHMTWEETSDMGAFLSGGDWLHHVHIASRRTRNTPGEDGEADNYVLGFKGLKAIGYQDFVSFECGARGDREKVVPAAVKLIRDQWAEA